MHYELKGGKQKNGQGRTVIDLAGESNGSRNILTSSFALAWAASRTNGSRTEIQVKAPNQDCCMPATSEFQRKAAWKLSGAGLKEGSAGAVLIEAQAVQPRPNEFVRPRRVDSTKSIPRHEPLTIATSGPEQICCYWPEARLVRSKFLKIVLGGTAASHTCSGVGGGHFFEILTD